MSKTVSRTMTSEDLFSALAANQREFATYKQFEDALTDVLIANAQSIPSATNTVDVIDYGVRHQLVRRTASGIEITVTPAAA